MGGVDRWPELIEHALTDHQVTERPADGFAIGVVPGASYQKRTITLEPGDCLILYTDGVTEAFSPTGEEFSEARLQSLLDGAEIQLAESLVLWIVERVRGFVAHGTQSDDITCMVLAYRQPAGPLS